MKVPEHGVYPDQAAEVRPLLVDGGGDGVGRGPAVHDIVVLGEVEHPACCGGVWSKRREKRANPTSGETLQRK